MILCEKHPKAPQLYFSILFFYLISRLVNRYKIICFINPFQPSVISYKNCHLIYTANQMAGFYMKCSKGLKQFNLIKAKTFNIGLYLGEIRERERNRSKSGSNVLIVNFGCWIIHLVRPQNFPKANNSYPLIRTRRKNFASCLMNGPYKYYDLIVLCTRIAII